MLIALGSTAVDMPPQVDPEIDHVKLMSTVGPLKLFYDSRKMRILPLRPTLMGAVQNFCSKLPSEPFSVDLRPKGRLDGC